MRELSGRLNCLSGAYLRSGSVSSELAKAMEKPGVRYLVGPTIHSERM